MGTLVFSEQELIKFIRWLRSIEPLQGYLLVMMVRRRGLKERFGFRGSDHVLTAKLVHGYLNQHLKVNPLGEVEQWRLRLYSSIVNMAFLAKNGYYYYVKYKPGTTEVEQVSRIPWPLIAVYISINPVNVLRASLSTVKEVQEAVWKMVESRELSEESYYQLYRRPDIRYYSNAMRHTITRFHTVDIDDKHLAEDVLSIVEEELGFRPAIITTARGIHILIELPLLHKLGVINKWSGSMPRDLSRLLSKYKQHKTIDLAKKLKEEALYGRGPLYHRLQVLGKIMVGEGNSPLIEVKKRSLEPIPGLLYKGSATVSFDPEKI